MFRYRLPAAVRTFVQGAALSVVLALPAAAATMQAVYTATVDTGWDVTGVFGTPDADLQGALASVTFVYDTSLGVLQKSGSGQSLYGGTAFGPIISPVSASITINGITRTNSADTIGTASTSYYTRYVEPFFEFIETRHQISHTAFRSIDDGVTDAFDFFDAYFDSEAGSMELPVSLTKPFIAELGPGQSNDFGRASFEIRHLDHASGYYSDHAYGSLSATKVVVTRVSAVPLPAALPMLAVALGGLALAAGGWRRR